MLVLHEDLLFLNGDPSPFSRELYRWAVAHEIITQKSHHRATGRFAITDLSGPPKINLPSKLDYVSGSNCRKIMIKMDIGHAASDLWFLDGDLLSFSRDFYLWAVQHKVTSQQGQIILVLSHFIHDHPRMNLP